MAKMPTPTFAMTAGEVPVAVKAGVHVIEVPAAGSNAKGAARVPVPGAAVHFAPQAAPSLAQTWRAPAFMPAAVLGAIEVHAG